MAYIKHDKQFWDTEADWIVKEFAKPSRDRMGMFEPYCAMQLHHCEINGTSSEAAEKIRKVVEAL